MSAKTDWQSMTCLRSMRVIGKRTLKQCLNLIEKRGNKTHIRKSHSQITQWSHWNITSKYWTFCKSYYVYTNNWNHGVHINVRIELFSLHRGNSFLKRPWRVGWSCLTYSTASTYTEAPWLKLNPNQCMD